MSELILSPEEIEALTDRKQPKRQIEWLINPPVGEPWKFTIGATGLPKVDRAYYDDRMSVQQKKKQPKVRTAGLARMQP